MGVQFGFLFGGTLLIEVIYSYPRPRQSDGRCRRTPICRSIQAVGLTYCVVVLVITRRWTRLTSCSIRSWGRMSALRHGALRPRAAWPCIVVLIAMTALFAPLLAPHDRTSRT